MDHRRAPHYPRHARNSTLATRFKQYRIEECMSDHRNDNDYALTACLRCHGHGVAATCPSCGGAGGVVQFESLHAAQRAHEPLMLNCPTCCGRGQLPIHPELAADLVARGAIPAIIKPDWDALEKLWSSQDKAQ